MLYWVCIFKVCPVPIQTAPRTHITDFEKRNAFLDPNIHHGFRTGYLDSPQAAGQRFFPSTIDPAGFRPASVQDAVDNHPRGPAAVNWPRHITTLVELDRGFVHTAATWQQCLDPASGTVDARFSSVAQPHREQQRQRQQRHDEERDAREEDAVSAQQTV